MCVANGVSDTQMGFQEKKYIANEAQALLTFIPK
jgi:hypothetical protein